MFSIHPLGPHLGSACALLDCGETALLLDTGFGYCAPSALTQLRGYLEAGDAAGLEAMFRLSSQRRAAFD